MPGAAGAGNPGQFESARQAIFFPPSRTSGLAAITIIDVAISLNGHIHPLWVLTDGAIAGLVGLGQFWRSGIKTMTGGKGEPACGKS